MTFELDDGSDPLDGAPIESIEYCQRPTNVFEVRLWVTDSRDGQAFVAALREAAFEEGLTGGPK